MNRKNALAQLSSCLRGQVPVDADWSSILSLANEQLVTPRLHESLAASLRADPHIPAHVRSFLADVHERSCARNDRLAQTLGDVLDALNRVGIEPVLLKGSALLPLESTPARRSRGRILTDLDLLVRSSELETAVGALLSAGFRILEDYRDRGFHPVVEFARPIDVGAIDLHVHTHDALLTIDDLYSLCVGVEISGRRALRPSAELLILTTVLHDQLLDGSFWRGGLHLRHLLDIADLAQRESPGVDWQTVFSPCSSRVVRSAVKTELLLAHRIAGAAIPDWVFAGHWPKFNAWYQTLYFAWPILGAVARKIGFGANVCRALSAKVSVRNKRKRPST